MAATADTLARRANPDISYPSRLYWPFDEKPDRPCTPLLFAFSPVVAPRPVEWGAHIHIPRLLLSGRN